MTNFPFQITKVPSSSSDWIKKLQLATHGPQAVVCQPTTGTVAQFNFTSRLSLSSPTGGVTEAAAGATAWGEGGAGGSWRLWSRRWRREHGRRLRARRPLRPQPGGHGASPPAGAGRAAAAARAPVGGAGGREGAAAAGGGRGHGTRSADTSPHPLASGDLKIIAILMATSWL